VLRPNAPLAQLMRGISHLLFDNLIVDVSQPHKFLVSGDTTETQKSLFLKIADMLIS
jgi:hypothetical protein